MRHHLTGSKKKARTLERARRIDEGLKKRLARIYELARLIRSAEELETLLAQLPDDPVVQHDGTTTYLTSVREETRKLIQPFLLFQVDQQLQGPGPDPDRVGDVAADLVLTDQYRGGA